MASNDSTITLTPLLPQLSSPPFLTEIKIERAMADSEHNHRPWRRLHGKVVMVTGASSGIGRDLCLDLAKAGCRVIAAARRTDRLQSLCEEIEMLHGPSSSSTASEYSGNAAAAVALDVTADGAAIDDSVQQAWTVFGRIDALVNNAGIRGGLMPFDQNNFIF